MSVEGEDTKAQMAAYQDSPIPIYRGNPFIEAMPPLLERVDAQKLMTYMPEYDPAMQSLPGMHREHLAGMVMTVRQPTWLHGEMYSRFSRLICNGYVSRNPMSPRFQHLIAERTKLISVDDPGPAPARGTARLNGPYHLSANLAANSNGMIFLGTSGIGKSTAIDMVLGLWPQLIVHTSYRGLTFSHVQIIWMKMDIPDDGGLIALAKRFFMYLDDIFARNGLKSDFQKAYVRGNHTEQTIAPDMARVAQQVGLGLLVLDELQDLSPVKSQRFLAIIVQIVNITGVPIVLVGGLNAHHMATTQFRNVRRGLTEGDLVVTPSEPGDRWANFCQMLWRYQFTRKSVEITDDHVAALYEMSQGITELLVIAYKAAQIRAISIDADHVTPKIIRGVKDSMSLAQPALNALKRGSAFVIDRMSDLKVPSDIEHQPFLRAGSAKDASAKAIAVQLSASARPAATDVAAPPKVLHASPAEVSDPTAGQGLAVVSGTASEVTPRPTRHPSAHASEQAGRPSLLETVLAGKEQGRSPRESLSLSGFGDGPLWRKITGLEP